ncbi:fatty acid desaturase [Pacificimonas sp. WHA3]|uniref:Fatty acid desaturase n=1 Tax=Pacificimonas pallii TaxID=2827236 RepID=A0ABS6SJ52_9SPHN|nr:fatty acid desaturase [Pacificimonas pallii]MBV7257897.1 fatty acid desaturase [Pacificimonas pallii]
MTKRAQSTTGLTIAAIFMVSWLSLHFAAIFLIDLADQTVWPLIILVAVQTWLSTGLFITAHDAMHGALAPSFPRLQRWTGMTALMIYAGLDYRQMEPAHFEHHRNVGTAQDPDFNADDPRRFVPWLTRFFTGYYTHGQLLRITLVALIYLLLGANLLNIVLFWAVPAVLALLQLFTFGTWLPHRHADDAFPDRHRARSNRLPELLSLLTCFHFGGYHHEHHLFPSDPWWRLPARRKRERSKAAGYIAG